MLVSLIVSAPITDCYGFNMLAAQLKKLKPKGVNLQLFYIWHDFNKSYPQSVIDQLVRMCKGSGLVGLSLLSSAHKNSVQITSALKKEINCPIIWGGKHPSIDSEECIKHVDMICIGEGEDTLVEVVENILNNRTNNNVLGLWVKDNGSLIKNALRPLETNLDKFEFPDYGLNDKYILDPQEMKIRPMVENDLDRFKKWYPTMITRGCPNCCTFCTNSTDMRLRKMRSRSVDNVILEVKNILKMYSGIEKVFFRDDCISSMPMSFIEELSGKWKKEIGLPCSCSGVIATSPNFRKKVELLTAGGFVNFKLGIQSGNERVRRFVFARVGETNEVIKAATRDLHDICKAGKINYYMITDNPYETEDELIDSIHFTSTLLRPFSLSLYSLNFYPGTALYLRALRDGIIEKNEYVLQESTMILKNRYLNKVYLLLRFFELPHFFVKIMTNKKIYNNQAFITVFNKIFRFLLKSDIPDRYIPTPAMKKIYFEFKKTGRVELKEIVRWAVWCLLGYTCVFYQRLFHN